MFTQKAPGAARQPASPEMIWGQGRHTQIKAPVADKQGGSISQTTYTQSKCSTKKDTIVAISRLEAGTRFATSHKSAKRPPQSFNRPHAKNPLHRKRVSSTGAMFCARVSPKWNRVFAAGMSTALPPYISEPGTRISTRTMPDEECRRDKVGNLFRRVYILVL
jgi:hypothetical protein